jgi:gluconokinase
MTQPNKTPRSPYEKIGGLHYLGRAIDKIRFKQSGQLRPDFYELMGKGFDARIMGFLELDYSKFAEFVLTGASDEECWDYCVQNGRKLNELNTLIWNDFSSKRGWCDSGSEILEKFKAESGLSNRTDLVTLFEYWEVDEGRKP